MKFENFFILIGRTFLSAFFLVNFFNIFPFNFSTNAWFVQVSMLFVDTASLLLLGLASFKLCAFFLLNKNADKNDDLSNAQINNIQLIDKFSKFGVYFFLFLALAQFFIFFNGIRQVNSLYMFQYEQIEQRYETQKEKISSKFKDNNQNITNDKLGDLPTSLDIKKKMFVKDLNKANSKAKFLLIRGNVKVFLMSLVWTYGLYKLSSFRYGN